MFTRAVFVIPVFYQQLFYVPQPPPDVTVPFVAPIFADHAPDRARNLERSRGGLTLVPKAPAAE